MNVADPKSPAAVRAAADPSPEWKILKHPVGLSIRYPRDWTLKELPEGFQLIPPGASSDQEVYLLAGMPAEGIRDATDPRVAAAVEALMAQLAPALKRVGPVEQLKAGDVPAIALTWEGGPNGRARMHVIILKGHAIGLTGIGVKEKIQAREPLLKRIFTSFAQNEGQRDPQLVGLWNRLGTTELAARDNAGRLQASSAGDHRRTIALQPDGTCVSREVSRTIAIGQGVAIDSGDQVTTKRGKWFAGDGRLVLMWENDADEYEYRLTGQPGARQLVFVLDGGKGLVWQEGR